MANIQSIPIFEIVQSTARTEQITVRVMHLWLKKSETDPTELDGVELILVDQNGDIIQATIKKKLVKLFLELLNEGDTYKIRKFGITSNKLGYDMSTYHSCKIWFEYSTRVVPVTIADIPLWKVSITTTWGASKVVVNSDMNAVHEFNNSFLAAEVEQNLLGVPENAAHHPPILASANIKTLEEIQNLTKGGSYVTMATFVELDTSGISWFYNSCKECRSKVHQKDDGLWYCDKERPNKNPCTLKGDGELGTQSAIPRFQVKFLVTYVNAKLCEFIIWYDAMTELLGKTAQQILDEDEIFNLAPPLDFRPLVEKDFIVKISVNQECNIEQKSSGWSHKFM
ncbi:uncharacterized protein LOC141629128 [Silene latifolia]|uniref:uncharacterized protein LOC141629128 n=1 Tax=Silene latifolia TaxID=37657 RepID=UPI003D77DA6B